MNPASTRPDSPAPIVAREGWPIVVLFIVIAMVLAIGVAALNSIAGSIVAFVGLVLCIWCVWFFRDPQRRIPTDPAAVVCPADGVVCMIGPAAPPADLGFDAAAAKDMVRVCVFMNVFNVHVNRAPVTGTIVRTKYSPGKFLNAAVDKASTDNERMGLVIRMADGREVASVQIAGLIARRIICRVKEGISLVAGDRYGLIRFGSRVDVYMPAGTQINVAMGERVVAGETVLATLKPVQTSNSAEIHTTTAGAVPTGSRGG